MKYARNINEFYIYSWIPSSRYILFKKDFHLIYVCMFLSMLLEAGRGVRSSGIGIIDACGPTGLGVGN